MRRSRKILIAAVVVLGVAVLIAIVRHYQLRAEVDAYIAQLKAKGEPMELAQVIPPPVPPEQNGAPLITNALAQINSYCNGTNWVVLDNSSCDMNRAIPGKEMVGWHQPVIHSPDTWPKDLTNTWNDLGVQLAGIQDDLSDCRKLIQHPLFDFHYDYSDPQNYVPVLAPHLSQIKSVVYWLKASEFYDLHRGKSRDACTDVRAMLAFVRGETDERFEISQLVRLAYAEISADATWNILQITNVTDADLVPLQQDWQSLEFIVLLKNAFLFERIGDLQLIDSLRQSPTNLLWWLGSAFIQKGYRYEQTGGGVTARWVVVDKSPLFKRLMNKISIPWTEARWRWFWSYQDELHALKTWEMVLDGIQNLETNHSFIAVRSFVNTDFARLNLNSVTNNPFEIAAQNARTQLTAIREAAGAEVARNVVVAAIAIKRYQLRYHQLPESLTQLVPEFLKSIPTDFMDGQPLRYRRNADGTFLLYSVGEDGKDDGGDPEPADHSTSSDWLRGRDWVWPQLATPEEIRAYYARQKNSH